MTTAGDDKIDAIIEATIGKEGKYSFNPNDAGGETCWGITAVTARRYGYSGPMKEMPRSVAKTIYRLRFLEGPGFHLLTNYDDDLAAEMFDFGVNSGPAVATMMLQRLLNSLNRQGKDFADIKVDGDLGPATRTALNAFLTKRGADGHTVILKGLRCLRGARFVEIAEDRPANEDFVFGWLLNRVA